MNCWSHKCLNNETADNLAKSEITEIFIFASCANDKMNWNRQMSSWNKSKNCLKTKWNVGWVSPRLSQRLLSLKKLHQNQV